MYSMISRSWINFLSISVWKRELNLEFSKIFSLAYFDVGLEYHNVSKAFDGSSWRRVNDSHISNSTEEIL